jgi:hypothetical protein
MDIKEHEMLLSSVKLELAQVRWGEGRGRGEVGFEGAPQSGPHRVLTLSVRESRVALAGWLERRKAASGGRQPPPP